MIVDPPRHCLPWSAFPQAIGEPGNDDRGHGSRAPSRVAAIPDVAPVVALVRRAVVVTRVAERVYFARAVSRTDRQASECCLQWLEELLAETPSCCDRQIRIGGQVGDAVQVRDVAVQEVAHKE